jgi:hypothetical protein
MDTLLDQLETCGINDKNNNLIQYIYKLNIPTNLKTRLINLIENDNHTDYLEIYNICVENDIELPPLF